MDKLIEDYKEELRNDNGDGYGIPVRLKMKILKELDKNKFTIPVEKVDKMIQTARKEGIIKNKNIIISDSVPVFSVSCENCGHFFVGMGLNEGKRCMRDNVTSLLNVDTSIYSCSYFKNKYSNGNQ